MTHGVSRAVRGAFVLGILSIVCSLLGATGAAQAAAASAAGPPIGGTARDPQVSCRGDVASPGVPVLLVHGTGLSAEENWGSTYRPALLARGHRVCVVDLPAHAAGDVQLSIEHVASAITEVAHDAGRRIAVVGHSQGAYLPQAALRVWPDLAPLVDDVVGLAGVYDSGSAALRERCLVACTTALRQLASGSHLLRAIGRRDLPSATTYTNVGTTGDLSITPQPVANLQRGAVSVSVQDVCPGRVIGLSEHAEIIGDAAAFALVTDALDHPGPAVVARVPSTTCDTVHYAGFDPAPFMSATRHISARIARLVTIEPTLRCYLRATCTDATARGRLLSSPRIVRGRETLTLRATATQVGVVQVVLLGRAVVREVQPGPVRISVPRPRAPVLLQVSTRTQWHTAWAVEVSSRLALPGRVGRR